MQHLRVSRKKRASVLPLMVRLAAIVALSVAIGATEASAGRGRTLTLSVDVDEASFVGPVLGEQGAFHVEGDTGSGAGTFQCLGWILEDGATTSVSQVYTIAGRGSIMTQGQEGSLLAVVGGTGDFDNARGEGLQTFTGVGIDFTFEVNLKK